MLSYSHILQGDDATNENALDVALGLDWSEIDLRYQIIKHKNYRGTVNGIDIYYDFGADYYFFQPHKENDEIKSFYDVVSNHTHHDFIIMRYCNNLLSYAIYDDINEGKTYYCLCNSPRLEAIINSVISKHNTYQEMIDAFYVQRSIQNV